MTNPNVDPVEFSEPSGPDFTVSTETEPPRRLLPGRGAGQRKAAGTDTPPKSRRTRAKANTSSGPKPKVEIPDYTEGVIAEGMTRLYGGISMYVGLFDPHCATLIMTNAQSMAASMERLAKESPEARAFLERLMKGSAIAEVIGAHAPVFIGMAIHHVPALRNKFNPGAQESGNMGAPGTPQQGQAA